MSAKHTPGEWVIRGGFTPEHTCIIGKTGDVIDSFGKPKKSNGEPIDIEEHRANARLIAAAPEMLTILERAADYMGEMGHPEDLLSDARTIIRKARGE